MRVLITGGMGVIGSQVARLFVERGLRPILYGRHLDLSLIKNIENKVDIVLGDILDLPRLLNLVKSQGVSHVIHGAALIIEASQRNPYLAAKINSGGTVNALECARIAGVRRFVYLSARTVLDISMPATPGKVYMMDEMYTINPPNVYGATKLAGELMGRNYRKAFGLDFVALRFATIYGPGRLARHGSLAVHSAIVENAFAGVPTRLERGGDQLDDLIYAKDAANGVLLACTADRLAHDLYNIASGRGITLKEFAAAVKKFYPDASIEIGPGYDYLGIGVKINTVFDVSRATEDLGFRLQYNLAEGIKDYIESLSRLKQLWISPKT